MDKTLLNYAAQVGAVGADIFSARSGEMTLLNSASSYNAPFSERLTQFAVGIERSSGVRELREFIAPTVDVSSQKFDYQVIEDQDKLAAMDKADLIRARGGEFRHATITGRVDTGSVVNYGLSTSIEYADLKEDPNLENESTDMLLEAVDTMELVWAFDLLDATAIAKEISVAQTKDIDSVIKQELQKNYDDTKISVNSMFVGGNAWAKRDVIYRNATLTPGTLNYAKTEAELGSYLGLNVKVGDARTINALGAMPLIRSNDIYVFFANPTATRYDASNIKFFSAKGLNKQPTEMFMSEHYQGVKRNLTLSRWGKPLVTNGFGVMKFTLVD